MSRAIKDLTDEELYNHIVQWRKDSIEDSNRSAGMPLSDIKVLGVLVKGLTDDMHYVLGIIEEIMRRKVSKD